MQITKIFIMASNLLCTISLFTFLFLFTSPFQTFSVNSVPLPSEKVSLGLYYQSLAHGCAKFITEFLSLIFDNGLISIVDLHLSPWGNSKIVNNETFVCQGGEKECYLNTIEACAINAWPDVLDSKDLTARKVIWRNFKIICINRYFIRSDSQLGRKKFMELWEAKHFNFINCVELEVANDESSQWETCYDRLELDRTPIDECYKSGLGKKLEFKYANETAALKPPHLYTPWVVIDGNPIFLDFHYFMNYICKAYKGSSPPEVCTHLPIITSQSNEPKKIQVSNRAKKGKFTRLTMIQA